MTDYLTELASEKKFSGNVVIHIAGNYFAVRQPDSGLVIAPLFRNSVGPLTLNPSEIDLQQVTTTIASYTFTLLDLQGIITKLIAGSASALMQQEVTIWLGRSNVGMDFSEYFQLPIVKVKEIEHSDNTYTVSATEDSDRMDRPIFGAIGFLDGDILAATTTITMSQTITGFPASGMIQIEDEFISYSGINDDEFTGCLRGLSGSIAADHAAATQVQILSIIQGNPIDLLLQILISNGGSGVYDVLPDGLGISEDLVDIAGIQALKTRYFSGRIFSLNLTQIDSGLTFFENELLLPNNIRFTYTLNSDSKLTLEILDRAQFVDDDKIIDEDTLTDFPDWTVDASNIFNQMVVHWDYDPTTQNYNETDTYNEDDSIAEFGVQNSLELSFQGIKAAFNGQAIVDDLSKRLFRRLAFPTPRIDITTQIDKSLQNIGEKTVLKSTQVPSQDGTLNFEEELEILSRSVSADTGSCSFTVAYTSYTGIRGGYIAPSDLVVTVIAQNQITVATGRGKYYQLGYVMLLWDMIANAYTADPINTITDVTGDTITFANNFSTTLIAMQHRIRFALYADCNTSQKRYCFIAPNGSNFADGKPPYRITI